MPSPGSTLTELPIEVLTEVLPIDPLFESYWPRLLCPAELPQPNSQRRTMQTTCAQNGTRQSPHRLRVCYHPQNSALLVRDNPPERRIPPPPHRQEERS